MKPKYTGLFCGVAGIALLLWPSPQTPRPTPPPPPVVLDLPGKAFAAYEKLWRKHTQDAADKIVSGTLKDEKSVWDFLAAGQEPARKVAFDELAKSEQDYFIKQGGWSAAAHEKLLRSYAK
jgi:hypothetical protein